MSYMEPGLRYRSKPTEKSFTPRPWIADGIRRSVDDGSLAPGTPFVTNEDYMKMMIASESVAAPLAQHNYRVGKREGFLEGAGAVIVGLIFVAMLSVLGGCSTAPKPVRPTGPVRVVSSRTANVTAHQNQAYLLVKFTGERRAWPVRVVDEQELERMVPGTQVLMVRVTDTATVAQAVRAPRRGEAVLNIMIIP